MRAPLLPLAFLPSSMALTCSSGLYMIIARGTLEPPGPGVTIRVADALASRTNANITVAPVDYPATFTDPNYDESVADGGRAVQKAISEYAAACPQGKMAVLGYSQGAQITVDAICGGTGGEEFQPINPLPSNDLKNVVAIVLFGDPTHAANTTYDRGTSIKNGVFDRDAKALAVCSSYADRIVSYCDTGDYYCDRGNVKSVHATYLDRYTNDAIDFILDRFHASTPSTTPDSTPPCPSSPSRKLCPADSTASPSSTPNAPPASPPSNSAVPVVSSAAWMRPGSSWLVSAAAVVLSAALCFVS